MNTAGLAGAQDALRNHLANKRRITEALSVNNANGTCQRTRPAFSNIPALCGQVQGL